MGVGDGGPWPSSRAGWGRQAQAGTSQHPGTLRSKPDLHITCSCGGSAWEGVVVCLDGCVLTWGRGRVWLRDATTSHGSADDLRVDRPQVALARPSLAARVGRACLRATGTPHPGQGASPLRSTTHVHHGKGLPLPSTSPGCGTLVGAGAGWPWSSTQAPRASWHTEWGGDIQQLCNSLSPCPKCRRMRRRG